MDNYSDSEAPKSSGALKVILWILGIGVCVVILVCGVGGFLLFRTFKAGFSQDPPVIREVAGSITDVDLPDGYLPVFSMNLFGMKMAAFGDQTNPNTSPMLMLMEFPAATAANPEQMKQQMEQSLQQQGRQRNFQIQQSEQKTFTIRGQEQTVVINTGTSDRGGNVVQAMGTFSAKSGNPAMLMFMVPEDKWDEDEFREIVESMK